MWDYLQHLRFWDWLAFGTLLLILEIFGAGGYLLWIGVAAAITGGIAFLFPALPWTGQFLAFGVLAILTAVFWWRHQRRTTADAGHSSLNRRGSELLGRQFALHDAIVGGRGKIRVGDSLWLVSGPDLPAGTQVRVTGQDGVLLLVEPA
ncbi:NfeD family protein [Pseudomonas panipatensis]|uniref:NfeD family protein n=1 Tax=Pseudomonas panipatensis TaxID=428992 RepID=UPI0035AF1D1B